MVSNVAKRKPKARPLAKRAKAPSVGQSAIAGLREGLAHLRGEQVPGLVVRKPVDVAAVRKGTGLSQDKFAAEFGLAVAAVRAWRPLYLRMRLLSMSILPNCATTSRLHSQYCSLIALAHQ